RFEYGLNFFSLGDVTHKGSKEPPVLQSEFSEGDFHQNLLAVFAEAWKLHAMPVEVFLAGLKVTRQRLFMPDPVRRRHEHGQVLPFKLTAGVAKDLLGGAIGKQDVA